MEELEIKDKMIDLMSEHLTTPVHDKKWVIEYFENLAKEFVEKALEITEDSCYTIMFLKIQFLEGQARLKLFKKYPPKYVYVNSARQLCAMNGEFEKYKATALCYCWFVWQKGYNGEPIIRWI